MLPQADNQRESVSYQVCKVLWHLDIFRRSFRELSGHACMRDSCIFCALKELFAQFQYSHDTALPPDALRRALAETFFIQQRFQLGFMDDAAECFENILMRIHFHIANAESEDMCNATHCIPHQKFAMTLVEQGVCRACGATSEPLPFTQMVHYISSSALCAQAKINRDEGGDGVCGDQFGQLLRKAGGMGEIRDCPSACGAKIQIHRTLMNHPDIVSIGIVWDSERPTLDHIMDVFRTIGTTIRLQDVFHSVVDDHWASSATHQLVGVVTYYGKHYSTFFFHTKLRVWIYFDDATVREIGPHWEQVVEKCRRGHFQPLLLLYANPYGTSVSTESSPKTVSYVSGHRHDDRQGTCYNPYNGYTHNLNAQRRAVTPNPEVHHDHLTDIRPRRAITPNADLHHREAQLNDVNAGLYHPEQVDSDMGYSSADRSQKAINGNRIPNGGYGYYGNNPQSYGVGPQKPRQPDPAGPLRANGYFNNCDVPDSGYMAKNQVPTNAAVYQQNGMGQAVPENIYISRKTVENVLNYQKVQRHRHLGGNYNGTTAGNRNSNSSLESFENALRMRGHISGAYVCEGKQEPPEAAQLTTNNVPRCRDSGNWSGDRNSASSTSSASMENPYYILVGNKRPASAGTQGYRFSPSKTLPDTTSRPPYDAGYDSFSLSSNDSFPINQHLHPKHTQQLAQIPENVFDPASRAAQNQDECQTLCIEADKFLEKSVEKENTGDIDGAISLCNGAAAKARAAMDAPYSNPQILAFARMKHNVCVMRARSLHRRMLVRQDSINSHGSSSTSTEPDSPRKLDADAGGSIHHSRQSSRDSTRSRSGNHSRQSSRDGGHVRQSSRDASCHSRQSSQDAAEKKRIELYGTLPKKSSKKKLEKPRAGSIRIKDERALHGPVTPSPAERPPQMLPAPTPQPAANEWPDYGDWEGTRRPNLHRTNSIPPNFHQDLGTSHSIPDLSKEDASKVSTTKLGKKQHKIRRKLMGGLIRRKNRSMPDLREGQDPAAFEDCLRKSEQSVDMQQGLYSGDASRRLYSSHGKIPPPPPVRTTSQLTTRSQSHGNLVLPPPSPDLPPPPPELLQGYFPPPPDQLYPPNQMTVQADVHHERTPSDNIRPVCLVRKPSIGNGRPAAPSCQRPPASDNSEAEPCPAGGLLAELRLKRQQILDNSTAKTTPEPKAPVVSGSNWLRELQAKQQQMLVKKSDGPSGCKSGSEAGTLKDLPATVGQQRFASPMMSLEQQVHQPPQVSKPLPPYREEMNSVAQLPAPEVVPVQYPPVPKTEPKDAAAGATDYKPKSVRDLASRFEQILLTPPATGSPPQPSGVPDRQPEPRKETNHDRVAPSAASPHFQYQQPPGGDCIDGPSRNGYGAPATPIEPQNASHAANPLNRVYECRQTYSPVPAGAQITAINRCGQQSNDWPYRTEQAHLASNQLAGANQHVSSVSRSDKLHYGDTNKAPNGWPQNYYGSPNPGDSASRRLMEDYNDASNGVLRRAQDERNDAVNGVFRRTQEDRNDTFRRTLEEHNNTTNPPDAYSQAPQNIGRQGPSGIFGPPEPPKCQRALPNYNPPPPVGPRAVPNSVQGTAVPPRQATYDQQALLMRMQQQQQQRRTPTSAVEQLERSATLGRKKKSKKSVTFSDQIVLVACADDDLMALPNPLLEKVLHKSSMASGSQPKVAYNPLYGPQHDEPFKAPSDPRLQHYPVQQPNGNYNGGYGMSPPNSGPTPNGPKKAAVSKVPCYLCGKKTVTPPTTYCSDCDFYMSRFKPKK